MATKTEKQLVTERKKIDHIDNSIVELIHQRVDSVLKIGELKKNKGAVVYRPEREKSIFERLLKKNSDHPFPDKVLTSIFKELISACRSLEAPIPVAYLGPQSSFTNIAALKQFGSQAIYHPYTSISEIFEQIHSEKEAFGIVPIENSTEGIVNHTLDLFMLYQINICSELYLSIHQNLLSREKSLKKIKTVISHPQCFGQCRHWLQKNLPGIHLKDAPSTSEAARLAAGRAGTAAIASRHAAQNYNLNILKENIEDNRQNHTRFVVLTKELEPAPTGADKTSILFSIPDKPGALNHILRIISRHKINMSTIVSRPSKKKAFEYSFFIDIDGHIKDSTVRKCLNDLSKITIFLRCLGSYPKGVDL